MILEKKRPLSRGVTHLMYVGDDEKAVHTPSPVEVAKQHAKDALPYAALGFVAYKTRGLTRWAALAAAAAVYVKRNGLPVSK